MASITGTSAPNTLTGTHRNDILRGLGGSDILIGLAGSDWLEGGLGADAMSGGAGHDTYLVDDRRDRVVESTGAGVDLVLASVTHALAANVDNLTLTGAAVSAGTGNGLANLIRGNNAANLLRGLGGNDTLFGLPGADRLNGGPGADTMSGGDGSDSYVVDHAADRTIERAGAGIDHVLSSVGRALGAHLENLTLTGAAAIAGGGNGLANVITGNGGDNRLSGQAGNDTVLGGGGRDLVDGGAGADHMAGGAGDDTYVVDAPGDTVRELPGQGSDTIRSSIPMILAADVENLQLAGPLAIDGAGNELRNQLIGNNAANRLSGGAGADILIGAGDHDTLTGGTGADHFVYRAVSEAPLLISVPGVLTLHAEMLVDFSRAEGDRIDLSPIDANSKAGGQQAFIFTDVFHAVAGELITRPVITSTIAFPPDLPQFAAFTVASGDVDGDGNADFDIVKPGSVSFATGDFIL